MKTFVLEHKTCSEDIGLGSVYWRRLTLDAQISNYLVGARSLGYTPDGVLYDVLRKPALRPLEANAKRKTPETPVEYGQRCLDDIASRPDYYYQRGIVVRLADEEREAAADLWNTADQIRLAQNAGLWPRNVDACSQYQRMCDYWPVCSGETTIESPLFESGETHRELETRHHLPLVTTSSARTFRACARRYQYAYVLGRRPRAVAGALSFGTMVHVGLATWMTTRSLDAAMAAMLPFGAIDFDGAKAAAMLAGYHARWVDEPLEAVSVEEEFVTELVNPSTGAKSRTFALGGKLDGVVRKAA